MNKKVQVLEMREKDNFFSEPSCNIEQAVMYLLGFSEESIKPVWVPKSKNSSEGEWLDSAGFDFLGESINLAESELQDAINEKCSEEIIKQKSHEVELCRKLITDGQYFQQAIIEEFDRGDAFKSLKQTNLDGYPSIRLSNLKKWAKEVLKISILDNIRLPPALVKAKSNSHIDELPPWIKNKQHYNTPPTAYEWQLAARYYAVEYLKENNDFINQVDLAKKVAGIMKKFGHTYGVNKEYDATTIRKAFPKFKFNGIKLSLIHEFFQKPPSKP